MRLASRESAYASPYHNTVQSPERGAGFDEYTELQYKCRALRELSEELTFPALGQLFLVAHNTSIKTFENVWFLADLGECVVDLSIECTPALDHLPSSGVPERECVQYLPPFDLPFVEANYDGRIQCMRLGRPLDGIGKERILPPIDDKHMCHYLTLFDLLSHGETPFYAKALEEDL